MSFAFQKLHFIPEDSHDVMPTLCSVGLLDSDKNSYQLIRQKTSLPAYWLIPQILTECHVQGTEKRSFRATGVSQTGQSLTA